MAKKVADLVSQNKDSLGDRRLRLFAVACCYRIWSKIRPEGKQAIIVAERFADGLAGEEELRTADRAADSAASWAASWASYSMASRAADRAAASAALWAAYWGEESAAQADILLSMLRPKRRPTEEERALFAHPDVQGLAQSIYWDRQWELCGVLADALEDAGCTWDDILSELRRSDVERYRGYWPVDVVLGLS